MTTPRIVKSLKEAPEGLRFRAVSLATAEIRTAALPDIFIVEFARWPFAVVCHPGTREDWKARGFLGTEGLGVLPIYEGAWVPKSSLVMVAGVDGVNEDVVAQRDAAIALLEALANGDEVGSQPQHAEAEGSEHPDPVDTAAGPEEEDSEESDPKAPKVQSDGRQDQ